MNIYQEDLDDFLTLAEDLQLKGLNNPIKEMQDNPKSEGKANPFIHNQENKHKNQIDHEIKMVDNFYGEEGDDNFYNTTIVPVDTNNIKTNVKYEDLDETINSMMEKLETGKYACKVCGKVDNKDKTHMRNHIEGKHISGISHVCGQCGKPYRSRHAMACHVSKEHRA